MKGPNERCIEFIAWDKTEKKWIETSDTKTSGNILRLAEAFPKDVIPIQYTGRKDKNKKKIYDGSIVQWRWFGDSPEGRLAKSVVTWDDYLLQWHASPNALYKLMDEKSELEVVGHICENPGLIA